jgi:predicted nucleic acid-binding protein
VSALVVDASAVVALVTPSGRLSAEVAELCTGRALAAPTLLPFEVSNVLRRREMAGLDPTAAHLAHQDLLDLTVELWPYNAVATRVRDLRTVMTAYDAAYVAVAEALRAPLVTLDGRLARAPGSSCEILLVTS